MNCYLYVFLNDFFLGAFEAFLQLLATFFYTTSVLPLCRKSRFARMSSGSVLVGFHS